MNLFVAILACATVFELKNSSAIAAETTNAPSGQAMDAFKIITQRNIFNPNRRPGMSQRTPPPRPAKIEAFSLVGTLHHEDGSFAFFEGTEVQYKKVLKPGEAIGGCKVVEIAPDSVKLEADDAKIDLPMGMQMKRQEAEKWQLVVGTASPASSSAGRERTSSSEADGRRDRGLSFDGSARRDRGSSSFGRRDRGPSSIGRPDRGSAPDAGTNVESSAKSEGESGSGAADDILKRLMENREKELTK